MRLPLAMALLFLVPASVAAQPAVPASQPSGTLGWKIEPSETPGRVQLEISRRSRNSQWVSSRTVDLAMLEGLNADQLAGTGQVHFRIARDAGTLECTGAGYRGRGTGECSFLGNARFVETLAARGIGRPTVEEQFSMALNDIGFAYLDELQRQRYDAPTAAELARAGDHGVTLAYLRDMGGHGYRVGRLASLVRMRDHGVTANYIEALARHDVRDVPPEDIVRLRDHGVSADYVGALRALGYRRLSIEELIRLRDHGVSSRFVGAVHAAGYRFGPDEMVRMRDHGVTESYVNELRRLGYADIGAEEIVRMRIHGVTPDFISRANGAGRRSPDELVRLRTGG